jgi:hypothetical protein
MARAEAGNDQEFIIGVSFVALGAIVVGLLDSAHAEHTVRQIVWQRELALAQRGPAALQPTRMPAIVSPELAAAFVRKSHPLS